MATPPTNGHVVEATPVGFGAGVGAGAGAASASPARVRAVKRNAPDTATTPAADSTGTTRAAKAARVGPLDVALATGTVKMATSIAAPAPVISASAKASVFGCVVKVYASMCEPNYSMPWQMSAQTESTASGFVIADKWILTNAHAVDHYSSVQVRKHGSPDKVNARVIAIGHDSDTALLTVDDNDEFWDGLGFLELGGLPELQARVTVVGYPTGGDNISVTAGVVSRVELHQYSMSMVSLLAIQIDAAINSGNSGGPAFHNGKVAGIAFETLEGAEGIGYIIPAPVVQHFLEDVRRQTKPRIGFGRLGFQWQAIENAHLRAHLKLEAGQSGIVVNKILPRSSVVPVLKKRDVIMAVDKQPIANDGTVAFRNCERIAFRYMVTKHFLGDELELKVLRNGTVLDLKAQVIDLPPLVPQTLYNRKPSYFVHAGMVFTVLSEPFLQADFGRDWVMKAPVRFVNTALNGVRKYLDEEVVVLIMMLSHPVNVGYAPRSFKHLQVLRVNGHRIRNIAHLVHVVDHLTGDNIRVELSGSKVIVLDRVAAVAATKDVLAQHNIAKDRSDDIAARVAAAEADVGGAAVTGGAQPTNGRGRRALSVSVPHFTLDAGDPGTKPKGDDDDDCWFSEGWDGDGVTVDAA